MEKWLYKHNELQQYEVENCWCGSEQTRIEFIRERSGISRQGMLDDCIVHDKEFKFICRSCGKEMNYERVRP